MSITVPASDLRAIAVAEAARRLIELRDRWLNPTEWVDWIDEPVPGNPRRPVPRDEDAAKAPRKRTLTNLYNDRPHWLEDAHAALDAAVAAAYGWPADITDDDALREFEKDGLRFELGVDAEVLARRSSVFVFEARDVDPQLACARRRRGVAPDELTRRHFTTVPRASKAVVA